MTRPMRVAGPVAGAASLVLGIAWLSSASVAQHPSGVARLRLSWSARPERIERCRALSAEELARREEHMRQRIECEGRFATYLLRVAVDSVAALEAVVQGAGFRHDRPLYLIRELDVAPGWHRLHVTFARREQSDRDTAVVRVGVDAGDTGLFAGRAQRELAERERRAHAAIPARLVLDTTVRFAASRVLVLSVDPDTRAFRLIDGASVTPPRASGVATDPDASRRDTLPRASPPPRSRE